MKINEALFCSCNGKHKVALQANSGWKTVLFQSWTPGGQNESDLSGNAWKPNMAADNQRQNKSHGMPLLPPPIPVLIFCHSYRFVQQMFCSHSDRRLFYQQHYQPEVAIQLGRAEKKARCKENRRGGRGKVSAFLRFGFASQALGIRICLPPLTGPNRDALDIPLVSYRRSLEPFSDIALTHVQLGPGRGGVQHQTRTLPLFAFGNSRNWLVAIEVQPSRSSCQLWSAIPTQHSTKTTNNTKYRSLYKQQPFRSHLHQTIRAGPGVTSGKSFSVIHDVHWFGSTKFRCPSFHSSSKKLAQNPFFPLGFHFFTQDLIRQWKISPFYGCKSPVSSLAGPKRMQIKPKNAMQPVVPSHFLFNQSQDRPSLRSHCYLWSFPPNLIATIIIAFNEGPSSNPATTTTTFSNCITYSLKERKKRAAVSSVSLPNYNGLESSNSDQNRQAMTQIQGR